MFTMTVVISVLVSLVLIGGFSSYVEETFYPGQTKGIKLPFLLHGGVVVGDPILIPLAVYYGFEYLKFRGLIFMLFVFLIAFGITWFFHRLWWFMCEKYPGYMYPNRNISNGDAKLWHRDLPVSAWVHAVYMVFAIMYLELYIFSSMPADVAWKTFWIFVVFVPFGVIEPGIVPAWPPSKKDIVANIGIAVGLWTLDGIVLWIKLNHFFGI